MCANGPHVLKILSDTAEYEIDAPAWISFDEIPDRGVSNTKYRVISAGEMILEVKDDRGSLYRLKKEGTELLENPGGQAHVSDLSLADFTESFGTDEIACGTSLVKELPVSEETVYEGPQYSDLSEAEKAMPAGSFLERDSQSYEIRENDGISLTLSVIRDGREYLAQLTPEGTGKAYFTRRFPVLRRSGAGSGDPDRHFFQCCRTELLSPHRCLSGGTGTAARHRL